MEATVDRAKAAIDTGHTGVKFGWEPFGRDERSDLAYVEAVRKAIGDENDFMLDVGLVWDAKTTIRRASLFEPYRLFWIEEPLHPTTMPATVRYRGPARNILQPRRGMQRRWL